MHEEDNVQCYTRRRYHVVRRVSKQDGIGFVRYIQDGHERSSEQSIEAMLTGKKTRSVCVRLPKSMRNAKSVFTTTQITRRLFERTIRYEVLTSENPG